MKKIKKAVIATIVALLSATSISAQKVYEVWDTPATEYSNMYGDGFFNIAVDITKVEFSDEETTVYLTALRRSDYGDQFKFQFAPSTYITGGGVRCPIIKAEGIELGKFVTTGKDNRLDMVFHFAPLPKGTKKFDLRESDEGWAFMTLGIKPAEECWGDVKHSYWRDENTGEWALAILEECVVYEGDFWDYKTKPETKKDKTTFTMTNGKRDVLVSIGKNKKGKRDIEIDGKRGTYAMITSRFMPDYPTKDTRSEFVNSGYNVDTITVVGWLKGMPEHFKSQKTINISYNEIISTSEKNVVADLDSLGRFKAKIPAINSTESFIDWGRCFMRNMFEAGKSYLFIYDFNEGRRYFMGDDVRLQNELFKYPLDWESIRKEREEGYDTYISRVDSLLKAKNAQVDQLCAEHPTLSTRFERYRKGNTLARQAMDFGQSRFNTKDMKINDIARSYAKETFWDKMEEPITLHRDIKHFIDDYIDDTIGRKPVFANFMDIADRLLGTEEELAIIRLWKSETKELNAKKEAEPDAEERNRIAYEWDRDHADLMEKLGDIVSSDANQRIQMNWFLSSKLDNYKETLDEMGAPSTVKDRAISLAVYHDMEYSRKPLLDDVLEKYKSYVSLPECIRFIEEENDNNIALEKKEFNKMVLKSSDAVAGISEGEEILKKLLEPYKGKIVLIDVWGTWCNPCKEALKHSQEEYKRLEKYDMVYLYLANSSPTGTWEAIIKEYEVTGDNVAHYNLPREQQAAIERYLNVHSYPTWKIVSKDGDVLDIKVDARHLDELEEVVKKLSE
ncbi:MAG: thioredoxin-like domain-containing protein [Bacteroidia bacterium]|nr:thioredoxin-like domain-containing protein [Bacteroidia bacterium]